MIAAAAAKVVDYTQFKKTYDWYIHENLLLTAFEDQQLAKAWEVRTTFRLKENQSEEAEEAVNRTIRHLLPWATKVDDLAGGGDRINHMIADWWRFFAGDKLPEILAEHKRRKERNR